MAQLNGFRTHLSKFNHFKSYKYNFYDNKYIYMSTIKVKPSKYRKCFER